MGLTTKNNVAALKTLIEGASFTNTDVIVSSIPSSSRGVDKQAQLFSRGNTTIMIMPKGYNPNVTNRNTQGFPIRYSNQAEYSITIYSRFLNTDKGEDLLTIHDGVVDLLTSNRYEWEKSDFNEAPQDFHSNTYYSAKVQVSYNELYKKV